MKRSMSSIHVGTSGWTYDDWAGIFYPPEVKGAERLPYYVKHFDTVEINASFYRIPTQAMIDAWNRRFPETFALVVKGPRLITHVKKLADCREQLDWFLNRVLQLRTLRVILWQLPPSLGKDPERLDGFLAMLPATVRHAVEFRHQTWWDRETADLLSRRRAAAVAISHPSLPGDLWPTSDFLYLRFHGLGAQVYRYDYSPDELAGWAERVKAVLEGRTLYAFFNNDYYGNAIRNARTFREMLMSFDEQDR